MREKLLNTFFTSDFTIFLLSDEVVVRKGRSGISANLSKDIVLSYKYNKLSDLEEILKRVKTALSPQPHDRWFLGLPLKHFTLINFTLPKAALENLDEAVNYALMRHVPYDLDLAHIAYNRSERGGSLDICAMIIPKNILKPFLKATSASGISLFSVFPSIVYWAKLKGDGVFISMGNGYGEILVHFEGRILLQNWGQQTDNQDDSFLNESERLISSTSNVPSTIYILGDSVLLKNVGQRLGIKTERVEHLSFEAVTAPAPGHVLKGYEINLLPRSIRRRQMLNSYLMYGGIVFFILSLLVVPVSKLAGQKRHLSKIESRIEGISHQADDLIRLREESRQILDRMEAMAEMKKAQHPALNILSELTESIPESAWLMSLVLSNKEVTIQGDAESATSVMEAVENSPMFNGVRFTSPVTRSGNRENFTLKAEVQL